MRIFKNKPFARFAHKSGITDSDLCRAVRQAELGLIDADLGGGVVKQRIARKGAGKSGGFRTLVLFRARERSIFVHGFAKSELENIRPDELVALRKLASSLFTYGEDELDEVVASGTLQEVNCDGESEAVS